MNNIFLSSIGKSFRKAMLRAHGGEPIIRFVAKRDDGTIMVRNERSYKAWLDGAAANDWIGWPTKDVYDYDEEIYWKLRALYEEGRRYDLEREWMNLSKAATVS
jgi:hypothetical protein